MIDNDVASMYPVSFSFGIWPQPMLSYGEDRYLGARLYTVFPVNHNWQELEQWCTEAFGPVSSLWDLKLGTWYMNDAQIMFRNESDRTLFALRWA